MKKSLIALASGTLGLGIAEFVMMGILPNVAHDLGISIPQAGHFISAYAIGVCVGAPLTVVVARTRPLKQILLGLAMIYIVGNLFASVSVNYWMLLLMRFVSGLPHGAFFGVGSIVAERVADKGKASQAVALMIAGMTIANLFGVPFGTLLSNLFSWRFPFVFNALWGVLIFYLIWRWIPYMPALPDVGLKGQFRFLKRLAPWLIILTTMFGNGGIFCWFSYVTPQMIHEAGFSPHSMTAVMMLAGLGMTIGNLVGGKCGDLYGLVIAGHLLLYPQSVPVRHPDVCLHGLPLCGLSSPAIIAFAELARLGDDGSGVCADRFQPGQCRGCLSGRIADRCRYGVPLSVAGRCLHRASGTGLYLDLRETR